MLQKTQWTLAAAALAVGLLLVTGARPAQAQFRIHLTGPVTTQLNRGIVIPPSSPPSSGIIIPNSTSSTTTVTPPASSSSSSTSSSSVSTSVKSTTTTTTKSTTTVARPIVSAPQGFSAGPSLLGAYRIRDGYMVNRVGPDLNGDGWPDIAKDPRSK